MNKYDVRLVEGDQISIPIADRKWYPQSIPAVSGDLSPVSPFSFRWAHMPKMDNHGPKEAQWDGADRDSADAATADTPSG